MAPTCKLSSICAKMMEYLEVRESHKCASLVNKLRLNQLNQLHLPFCLYDVIKATTLENNRNLQIRIRNNISA